MSKEYVEKVEALGEAKEMDDVVALFGKVLDVYPNALLYCSNIATKAPQGMTLIVADDEKTKEWLLNDVGILEGFPNQQTLAMTMLIAMIESVCREQGIEVNDFLDEAKEKLAEAKELGVIK